MRSSETRPWILVLVVALLAVGPLPGEAPVTVDEVLAQALRQADVVNSLDYQRRFRMRVRRTSEELSRSGEVRKREETLHEVLPVEGRWFERLVQRNGRALSPGQAARETDRERRFAESVRKGNDPRSSGQGVSFDRQLVDKYVWKMQPKRTLEGRSCYVLSFRPGSNNLPVRNRMDYALNKAEGQIWIDEQSFEVARVQFQLRDRVKLWWGLLGSISRAEGRVERRPAGGGVWLPHRFELYLNGRILFSSLHRRQHIEWTQIRPVETLETN